MPTANEKDAYYFPHDYNARNDPKISALRSVYGAEGYGVYWMIIEILREQPDYKLEVTKYLYATLAMQMHCDASLVQSIVDDCCTEFQEKGRGLFVNDGQYIYSESLLRRMKRVDNLSKVRSEASQARWNKEAESKSNANAMQMHSKEKKRKEKESKEKESKEKNTTADAFVIYASGDAAFLAVFLKYEEMRNKIKKPMTDHAKELIIVDLNKLTANREEQIAILNQSIKNSWQGVFALKEGPAQRKPYDKNAALLESIRKDVENDRTGSQEHAISTEHALE